MMSMHEQMEQAEKSILHTYNRFPVMFDRGEGCRLYDTEGKEYLDFAAGIAVNALGYHYPGYDEALKAAQTVLHCTRRYPVTLYLVDNASPDGSGKKLEQAVADGLLAAGPGQQVVVHCRTENGGFGTGHNMILPELDSDFHFILNPDIQLTADTLSDLADWMAAHPDAVMARPSLVFPDGKPQQLPLRRCNVRAMVYRQLPCLKFWAKYNERYLMADRDLTQPTEIEFCTGSFSAVDTAVFKEISGFDEGYFMYVEDADLTQKMRTKGKAYLVPQCTAIHAWHRAAHRSLKPFLWQLRSLLRYFSKWGFAW